MDGRVEGGGARTGLRIGLRGGAGSTGWDDGAGVIPRGHGPSRPLHETALALRGAGTTVGDSGLTGGEGSGEVDASSLRSVAELRTVFGAQETVGQREGRAVTQGQATAEEESRQRSGRVQREAESPSLVMGVRSSPPVRSRERSRDGGERRNDVSPVRSLWAGGLGEEEDGGGSREGRVATSEGRSADEQALSAGPEAAGRMRASEGRERREEE